jgi:hypothetical protein
MAGKRRLLEGVDLVKYCNIFLLLVAGLQPGCSREFVAPPPSPEITSIDPQHGFMGSLLVISGTNFSEIAGGNLVFFGSKSAKVILDGSTSLEVEVPQLQVGEDVFITVTTAEGLATSPQSFVYKGPGHPLQEELHSTIGVPAGPFAITPGRFRDGHPPPTFVADSWSHSIGLFDIEEKTHADVGVANSPFSIARAFDSDGGPLAFVTTLRSGSGSDLPTRLQRFPFTKAENIQFSTPDDVELPDIAGEPFLPGYLWSYCLDADCTNIYLAVFDLYRPALVLFDPANPGTKDVIYIDNPDSLCPDKPEDARPFGDLVRYDPGDGGNPRLLTIVAGQPEIWSLPEGSG